MANQQENMMRFLNAKDKARKLIQMDAAGEIDKARDKAVNEGKLSFNDSDEVKLLNDIPKNDKVFTQQNIIKNNNLPPEILESMMNNKIDTSSLGNGISSNGSVLDQINNISNGNLLKKEKEQNDNVIKNNNVQENIDYSMIKMIVESCMKKYVSSIKKSIINESKKINDDDSLQALKIGNKFSFITKNGDLYEAKLKFIKNINK